MSKVRVYELAKELGTDPKTLLAEISRLGEHARFPSSPLSAHVVRKVRQAWVDRQPPETTKKAARRVDDLARELNTEPDVLLTELQRHGHRIPQPSSPLTAEEIATAQRVFGSRSRADRAPSTPAPRWNPEDAARNLDPAWGRTQYALASKSRKWADTQLPAHAEALAAAIRSGKLRLRAPGDAIYDCATSGALFWMSDGRVRGISRSGILELEHAIPARAQAGLVGFAQPLPDDPGADWLAGGYPLAGDVVFRSVSWIHVDEHVHVVGWRLVDRRDAQGLTAALGYDVKDTPSWPWVPTVQITLPRNATVDLSRVADPAKRACLAAVRRTWAHISSGAAVQVPRHASPESTHSTMAMGACDAASKQEPLALRPLASAGVGVAEIAHDLQIPTRKVRAVARGFGISIAAVGETVLGPLHAAAVRAVLTGRTAIAQTRCDNTWHPAEKGEDRWDIDGCGCGNLEHQPQDITRGRALNRRHAQAAAACDAAEHTPPVEPPVPATPEATSMPTTRAATMDLTTLAIELDVPTVALRARMLRDHLDPATEPIPTPIIGRYRLLGGPWLTLTAIRHPADIDPTTPSAATLKDLAAHLATSTTDLTSAIRELTGTTPRSGELLPGYVVEAALADATDTAPPPGTPVPWSPKHLPTHIDRLVETLTTWHRHQHGATAAALTDAILVWARPAIWASTPTPEHGTTVEDLIPFPVGLTALEAPIPQPDGTALTAISWRYDDRTYTVTTQTWHTTAPGRLRAGLDWTPQASRALNMATHLPQDPTTHLGALRHIWAALAVTESADATRRHAPGDQPSPPPPTRQRTARDAEGQAVDIVHWRRQRPLRDDSTRPQQAQSRRDRDLVWRVRGHWRWARVGPDRAERRRVWVHEHFKGHGTEAHARRVFILDS